MLLIDVTNWVLKFDKSKDIKDIHLQNILSIYVTDEVSKFLKFIDFKLVQP